MTPAEQALQSMAPHWAPPPLVLSTALPADDRAKVAAVFAENAELRRRLDAAYTVLRLVGRCDRCKGDGKQRGKYTELGSGLVRSVVQDCSGCGGSRFKAGVAAALEGKP